MKSMTYHGETDVDYIFKPAPEKSDVLVVTFPGLGGGEFAASQFGFNYMITIGSFKVNALYLRGTAEQKRARWMCVDRDYIIERTVKALIDQCANESNSTHIIAVGSSMGGFCSTYYGLKYDWDVIAGAPPYLADRKFDDLMYACGGISKSEENWFNEQIRTVVCEAGKRGYNKKLFVSWGEGEDNWISALHGQKLVKDLDSAGIKYICKLYPYSDHVTVHGHFPNVLKAQLGYYLGLTDEPQDVEKCSDEVKLSYELKEAYSALVPLVDKIIEIVPNLQIRNCAHYGDLNQWTALRNYAYIQQGWYWGMGYTEPVNIGDKDAFWRRIPRDKVAEGLSFWFQDTLLNYYDHNGEVGILEWCAENARQYLEYICNVAESRHNENWSNSCRRMHFFIDLHRAMIEKGISANWLKDIPDEIRRDLSLFIVPDVAVSDSDGQYRRTLGILHAAVYFKNNTELYDFFYATAINILNKLTEYYFDQNGICIVMQIRYQSILAQRLRANIEFIEDNAFPETNGLKKLYRKYTRIVECAAHITRPDGIMPALGHSVYEQAHWTKGWVVRKPGNFIRRTSNIVFLEDEHSLSYITMNGGSNVHSAWRHCDLLSFTWFYDGKQLFLDNGGGNEACADYARSAIAHNAFICDEIDYITPDYNDWTSIDSIDEQEKYVIVAMSHMLIKGVVMRRKLLWLKPNVMIVLDEAVSDTEHKYTQNYILDNYFVENSDKINVIVRQGFTILLSQFPADNVGYVVRQYRGTADVGDETNFRGSLISGWQKLRKGLNLAYTKEGTEVKFLTVIECHSDSNRAKKEEVKVTKAVIDGEVLRVELTGGNGLEVKISG